MDQLSAYTPTLRERMVDTLARNIFGDSREGTRKAERLMGYADMTPVGAATGLYDAGRDAGTGNYAMAGVGGGLAALPLPGAVKQKAKKAARQFDFTQGFKVAKVGPTEVQYAMGANGAVDVHMVKTPKELRGKGSARTAMERMLQEADLSGVTLQLTPDPVDASTNKNRLRAFYERLGFQRNAGRNKDFSTRATHIRKPAQP